MLSLDVKKYLKEKKEAMDAKNKMIKQIENEEYEKAVKKKEADNLRRIRNNAREKAERRTGLIKRTTPKKRRKYAPKKKIVKLNMPEKVSKTSHKKSSACPCIKSNPKKIKKNTSSHKSKMMDQGINWGDFR